MTSQPYARMNRPSESCVVIEDLTRQREGQEPICDQVGGLPIGGLRQLCHVRLECVQELEMHPIEYKRHIVATELDDIISLDAFQSLVNIGPDASSLLHR